MSALINIKIGDPLRYEDGRRGILRDIKLMPNGVSNPEIVAVLYVEMNGSMISATSNRFKHADDHSYEEFYPSVHLNKLTDLL
jgi:hypothetical protein